MAFHSGAGVFLCLGFLRCCGYATWSVARKYLRRVRKWMQHAQRTGSFKKQLPHSVGRGFGALTGLSRGEPPSLFDGCFPGVFRGPFGFPAPPARMARWPRLALRMAREGSMQSRLRGLFHISPPRARAARLFRSQDATCHSTNAYNGNLFHYY